MKYYSEETVKNMLKDTRVEILTRNRYGSLVQDYRIIRPKVEDYPSIEITEPHGDLIDRQAVVKALNKAWNVDDDSEFSNKSVWRIIEKEAPTVLEASE